MKIFMSKLRVKFMPITDVSLGMTVIVKYNKTDENVYFT